MCINVPHYVLVVYMQVLSTTFRMCINVPHDVLVVYMQVLSTTFRMPVYYFMNVYLFVSAFINSFSYYIKCVTILYGRKSN